MYVYIYIYIYIYIFIEILRKQNKTYKRNKLKQVFYLLLKKKFFFSFFKPIVEIQPKSSWLQQKRSNI